MILYVILVVLALGLAGLCIYLYKWNKVLFVENEVVVQRNSKVEEYNQAIAAETEELVKERDQLKSYCAQQSSKLEFIKNNITAQSKVLDSLTDTAKKMQAEASNKAKEVYEVELDKVNKTLEEKRSKATAEMQKALDEIQERVNQEQDKLSDLEAKQLAYIQAQQRAEEIKTQKDYYRLLLDDDAMSDITILRDAQARLRKRDAVDKVIYETYYRQPYNVLMSHLFQSGEKECGIYKITNIETGSAYIGQSVDLKERMRQHIKSSLSSDATTNKLYQQMKKYGPENFTFEVLEIVERAKLNEREAYWIDFYKTKDFGMNGTKGNN